MATGAGKLRERIVFQRRGLDGAGRPSPNQPWDTGAEVSVYARVRPRTGTEPVIQARMQGVQPLEITIRANDATRAITTAWRALWKNRPLNLRTVTPSEDRAEIYILAEDNGSNG